MCVHSNLWILMNYTKNVLENCNQNKSLDNHENREISTFMISTFINLQKYISIKGVGRGDKLKKPITEFHHPVFQSIIILVFETRVQAALALQTTKFWTNQGLDI
jgi:hypothetical protein